MLENWNCNNWEYSHEKSACFTWKKADSRCNKTSYFMQDRMRLQKMVEELSVRTPSVNTGAEILPSVNLQKPVALSFSISAQQAAAREAEAWFVMIPWFCSWCQSAVSHHEERLLLTGRWGAVIMVSGVTRSTGLRIPSSEGDFPSVACCHLQWEQMPLPAVVWRRLAYKDYID